jgi:hypothetical protein
MNKNIPKDPWQYINLLTNETIGISGIRILKKRYDEVYKTFCEIKEKRKIGDREYLKTAKYSEVDEVILYNQMFIILGCAAIECWVNSFGITLLSEKFYKKNIERQDIIQKIVVLNAIHKNTELDENDVLISIRVLFEKRNALVHPKAKHLTESTMALLDFKFDDINDSEPKMVIDTIEKVILLFTEIGIIRNSLIPESI